MVHSNRRRLITALGALWLIAAGVAGAHNGRATPELQGQLPQGSHQAVHRPQSGDAVMTLRWVFRQRDLLSCRTSARDLRHVLLNYGDQVRVEAVAIDTDPAYVRSFLRGERLDAEVMVISEREYQAELNSVPTPSVQLVRAGRVVEVFTAGNLRLPDWRGTADLNVALERLMSASATASSRSSLPSPSHP
jgi:hypothetical protein